MKSKWLVTFEELRGISSKPLDEQRIPSLDSRFEPQGMHDLIPIWSLDTLRIVFFGHFRQARS